MSDNYIHLSPALRVLSGAQCLERLDPELARLGCARAVIFCGRTIAHSPLLEILKAAITERCAGVFPGVSAHSHRADVEAGAEMLAELEADAVIAVGGGSASVSARAAAILLAEGRDPTELATSRGPDGRLHSPRLNAPKLPQFVVPTTPNTAIVKVGSAIFDPESGRRLALFDPKTRAQAVFLHTGFLASAPRRLVVSAALDTLSQAIEGLCSPKGDPIADAHLSHAVRLICDGLRRLDDADDPLLRNELASAAILCGLGTDHTSLGVATVLAHAMGAAHALDNGVAKAIVLPATIRFNAEHAQPSLRKVALAMGLPQERSADVIAAFLSELAARLGLPGTLRELGIPETALAGIARTGMDDWFLKTNPRPVGEAAELHTLLQQVW